VSEQRRLDQWLFFARLFKSRSLAARAVQEGSVRVNRRVVAKPSHGLVPGDVLTFARGDQVHVVRVVALGTRRGPASEAQGLFEVI